MSEEFNFDAYDPKFFEELYTQIDDHPDWQHNYPVSDQEQELGEVAEDAAEFRSQQEIFYEHVDTDGQLHLMSPKIGSNPQALSGTLKQNIGLSASTSGFNDSFEDKLLQTQTAIAEETRDTDYVEINDSNDHYEIQHITVPFDYDPELVDDALDVLSETSQKTQELHNDIHSVLDQYR